MQPRRHGKIIQQQPCNKADYKKANSGNAKRQPENKKKINIWNYKPVQVGYPIENIYLNKDKYGQTENIFNQVTQCVDRFCCSYFFSVSFSNCICSSL